MGGGGWRLLNSIVSSPSKRRKARVAKGTRRGEKERERAIDLTNQQRMKERRGADQAPLVYQRLQNRRAAPSFAKEEKKSRRGEKEAKSRTGERGGVQKRTSARSPKKKEGDASGKLRMEFRAGEVAARNLAEAAKSRALGERGSWKN